MAKPATQYHTISLPTVIAVSEREVPRENPATAGSTSLKKTKRGTHIVWLCVADITQSSPRKDPQVSEKRQPLRTFVGKDAVVLAVG
jgi:acid phosphatase class B